MHVTEHCVSAINHMQQMRAPVQTSSKPAKSQAIAANRLAAECMTMICKDICMGSAVQPPTRLLV